MEFIMIGLMMRVGGMYRYGGFGYGLYFDPTYYLILIGAVLSLIAQIKVSSSFAKYSQVRSMSGMTGAMVAQRILESQGIYDVSVQRVAGKLTDHYNPSDKTLNLSESVYNSSSVAAVAVAAHETGHAIQHAKGYVPLNLRTAIVPVANLGSKLCWVFILAGFFFGSSSGQLLLNIGIIMFSAAVVFQIVTLPVEFNASHRALVLLKDNGILYQGEVKQARSVLTAAALTYVAATITAILQLLRLIILFGGRNRD